MDNSEIRSMLIEMTERLTRLETCFKDYVREQSSKRTSQRERIYVTIASLTTAIAVIEFVILR